MGELEEKVPPSEDDKVLKIVREELKEFVESLGRTAYAAEHYSEDELIGAGLRAIAEACSRESQMFPHDWKCDIRSGRPFAKCNCEVGDE